MSFLALDIPNQPADLAAWLERELVGLHLAELIAGLEACHPPVGSPPRLTDVLGSQADAVLTRGLQVLAESQLRQLLLHPRLLLELQERVLRDGGQYWRQLPLTPEHRQLVDETLVQVQNRMTAGEAVAAAPPSQKTGGGVAARRMPWRQLLSIAALLLVAFVGWWRFAAGPPGAASGWGWERPGALAFEGSAPDYLEHLARAAEEWFRKRPDTAPELRRRLEEFRRGCDVLLEAPHTPLAEGDREWLRERCRAWRDKIDGHLAALKAGGAVPAVRDEADATVRNLMKALRERAAAVEGTPERRSSATT